MDQPPGAHATGGVLAAGEEADVPDRVVSTLLQHLASCLPVHELERIQAVQRSTLQRLRDTRRSLSHDNEALEALVAALSKVLAGKANDLRAVRADLDHIHATLRSAATLLKQHGHGVT